MKLLFTAIGAAAAFIGFYFFCCFVAWEFPVNLGELDAVSRFYIGFVWILITAMGGIATSDYGD